MPPKKQNKGVQPDRGKSKQNLAAQTDSKKKLNVNAQTDSNSSKAAGNQTDSKSKLKDASKSKSIIKNGKDANANLKSPKFFVLNQPEICTRPIRYLRLQQSGCAPKSDACAPKCETGKKSSCAPPSCDPCCKCGKCDPCCCKSCPVKRDACGKCCPPKCDCCGSCCPKCDPFKSATGPKCEQPCCKLKACGPKCCTVNRFPIIGRCPCGSKCGKTPMGCGTFGGTPLHLNSNPICGAPRTQPLKNVCCPGGLTLIATALGCPASPSSSAKDCKDAECCTLLMGSNCVEKECCTDPEPRRQSWWGRVRKRGFNGPRGGNFNGKMGFPPPIGGFPFPPPQPQQCGQTPSPCPPCPPPAPPACPCQEQTSCGSGGGGGGGPPPMMPMPYPMPMPMPMPMGGMGGMGGMSCPGGPGMDMSMLLPMLAMKRMAWLRDQNNTSRDGGSAKESNNNEDDASPKDASSRGSKSDSKLDKIRETMEDRMRDAVHEKKDAVCARWKNICNAKRDICSDPQQRCRYGITEEECKRWQAQCDDVREICGSADEKEKEKGGGKGKGKKDKSSSKGSLPSKNTSSKKLKKKK